MEEKKHMKIVNWEEERLFCFLYVEIIIFTHKI